jgi:hypothetical protein
MRAVAWGVLVAFAVAALLDAADLIDLRAHAFGYLMGLIVIATIAQAWARRGDGEAENG